MGQQTTTRLEPELEAMAARIVTMLQAEGNGRELAASFHRALVSVDDTLCLLYGFSRKGRGRYAEVVKEPEVGRVDGGGR